jgi:hypothetical protein
MIQARGDGGRGVSRSGPRFATALLALSIAAKALGQDRATAAPAKPASESTAASQAPQSPSPGAGQPAPTPSGAAQPAPTPAAQTPPAPATDTRSPERPRFAYESRYHTLAEVQAMLDGWLRSAPPAPSTVPAAPSTIPDAPSASPQIPSTSPPAPGLTIERLDLPSTRGGLSVPALQWGIATGTAGKRPLAERPTVFLIGGLDGVSLSGCEAVLSVGAALLNDMSAPPVGPPLSTSGLTFVAIPWASPDALSATLAGKAHDGRNALPLDDDGDGRVDEDPPDDLDGDGFILDMLIEDPSGPWTRAADPRFLAPARPGDSPRYQLVPEGRDDDHDGRYNEDPPGGIDLNLDFPVGFDARAASLRGRPPPLADATSRALADLMLARKCACVLLFQGNHGLLATPGASRQHPWPSDADVTVFDVLTQAFAHATGRVQSHSVTALDAYGSERGGAALDWIYAVPGALCAEVAAWGPDVEKAPDAKGVAVADALFENAAASQRAGGPPPVSPIDRAWARWLDNTRGGIGFVDWHPVDLGEGKRALVGGFEPFSRLNPPVKSLAAALAGLPAFVQRIASALPQLDVRFDEVRRDGEVCTLRTRVENKGQLPTGLWTTGRSQGGNARTGVVVELVLPPGARLLTGEPRVELGHLCAGGASREIAWIVLAAAGSSLQVRVTSPWTSTLEREVKP